MRWCVKYWPINNQTGQGNYAVLYPHNTHTKVWYEDINAAHRHCIEHQASFAGNSYIFKVEEYHD